MRYLNTDKITPKDVTAQTQLVKHFLTVTMPSIKAAHPPINSGAISPSLPPPAALLPNTGMDMGSKCAAYCSPILIS